MKMHHDDKPKNSFLWVTQMNDVLCCKWKGLHRASTNKLRKRVEENAKVLPHPVMARRKK